MNGNGKSQNLLKKYKVKKNSIIWGVVLFVICLLLYVFCLIIDNFKALEVAATPDAVQKYDTLFYTQFIPIAKDFLLIFLSVIVTGFVSSFLIEIREKNNMFSDIVVNDIFSSDYFYNTMSTENKERILNHLETSLYFPNSPTTQEMYRSIREKLGEIKGDDIYYDSCDFNIICEVKENIIEKHIIRETKITSFSKSTNLQNFLFFSTSQVPFENKNHVKELKVYIDGKEVDEKDIVTETKSLSGNPLLQKSGYTETCNYIYKKTLNVSPKKSICIRIDAVTIVPIDDIVYTSRVKYPCKKFSLDYNIINSNQEEKYYLNATAYGFKDDGQKNVDMGKDSTDQVKISFPSWIFSWGRGNNSYDEKNEILIFFEIFKKTVAFI